MVVKRKTLLAPGTDPQVEHQGLIDALRARAGGEWDAGRHFWNIRKHRLYKKFGCQTMQAYLTKKVAPLGLDVPLPSEMSRWATIGFLFSKNVTTSVGMYRLIEAVTWWRHKGKTDFSRTDPGSELIEIPVAGGAFASKPLQACTEEELKAANGAFKAAKTGGLSTADAAMQALGQTALEKFVKVVGGRSTGDLWLRRESDDLYVGLKVYLPVGKFAGLFDALKRLF